MYFDNNCSGFEGETTFFLQKAKKLSSSVKIYFLGAPFWKSLYTCLLLVERHLARHTVRILRAQIRKNNRLFCFWLKVSLVEKYLTGKWIGVCNYFFSDPISWSEPSPFLSGDIRLLACCSTLWNGINIFLLGWHSTLNITLSLCSSLSCLRIWASRLISFLWRLRTSASNSEFSFTEQLFQIFINTKPFHST